MRRIANDMLAAEEPKRKLAVNEYSVPSDIRLEGERLFWQPVERWRKVKPTVETFADFLTLGDVEASARDVLAYARKWGVLNLCRDHKLPVSHDERCVSFERVTNSKGEPVGEWHRFARIAGAVLNISQNLTDGGIGKSIDWQTLSRFDPLLRSSSKTFTLTELGLFGSTPTRKATKAALSEAVVEGKAVIADYVNQWLTLGNVRPHMEWKEGEPIVLIAGGPYRGGLFGSLAVHLLELSGRYVIASCSGCRKFYNPEVRPKSGQDRFCKKCRDAKVAVQLASHRRNLKKAQERAQKRADKAPKR